MDTFKKITPEQAHEIMGSKDVTVVDIRDADSYEQGHIQGALPLNDENIKDFIESSDKGKPLICYCYHGISSQRAAQYLASVGFKQVYSLDGGFEGWKTIYG